MRQSKRRLRRRSRCALRLRQDERCWALSIAARKWPGRCARPSASGSSPSSTAAASFAAAGAVWIPNPPCPAHQKNPRARESISVDRQPVGREASEARPTALDRLDGPVDHALEPVDRDSDVDLLGRGVARIGRDLVVRAEPNRPVAFALEVEAAVGIVDQRQILEPRPPNSKLDHRPPLGLDPELLDSARLCDAVRPGARGIDQDWRLDASSRPRAAPSIILWPRRRDQSRIGRRRRRPRGGTCAGRPNGARRRRCPRIPARTKP